MGTTAKESSLPITVIIFTYHELAHGFLQEHGSRSSTCPLGASQIMEFALLL